MSATATVSPAVEQLFDMFRRLSADDQEQVREAFAAADDDDDIPEAHMKILREREARYAAGLSKGVPAEKAFIRFGKRFAKSRQAPHEAGCQLRCPRRLSL